MVILFTIISYDKWFFITFHAVEQLLWLIHKQNVNILVKTQFLFPNEKQITKYVLSSDSDNSNKNGNNNYNNNSNNGNNSNSNNNNNNNDHHFKVSNKCDAFFEREKIDFCLCLFIFLFIYLFFCQSVCLFICLFIRSDLLNLSGYCYFNGLLVPHHFVHFSN